MIPPVISNLLDQIRGAANDRDEEACSRLANQMRAKLDALEPAARDRAREYVSEQLQQQPLSWPRVAADFLTRAGLTDPSKNGSGSEARKPSQQDIERAIERAHQIHTDSRAACRYDYTTIVGSSDAMSTMFQQLDRIIESSLPVLILGETGTGKELVARALHENSLRRPKPLLAVNCAAVTASLLESELFGHKRGSFTGAIADRLGHFVAADGGSVFLDEIGDMPLEMQAKLLRVVQDGEVRPVGSNKTQRVDVRVVAATNKDLVAMCRNGGFREDLYYRIAVLSVQLPGLRERREDIPLLAEHLLARAAREAARPVPVLPHDVMVALVSHDWPGNVRELENCMRRALVLVNDDGVVKAKDLRLKTEGPDHQ